MPLNKLFLTLILPTILVCTIAGCSSPTSPYKVSSQYTSAYVTDADKQHQDDQQLAEDLNSKLDQLVPHSKIKVVVSQFNVLLVGQVISAADKANAEQLCAQALIATKVFNYLSINPNPKLNLDNSLSDQVMDRIKLESELNPKAVQVVAVDNVVYILGTNVGNLTTLGRVVKISKTIPGVKQLVNLVQTGPQDYSTN